MRRRRCSASFAPFSLSLMQPRPRLPTLSVTRPWLPTLSVTPLRPAEHYHTYGELELNRKTRGLHVKCWYNTTAHTQSESPASWRCQRDGGGLSNAMHRSDSQGGTLGRARRLEPPLPHATARRVAQSKGSYLPLRNRTPKTRLRRNWPMCTNVVYVRT